MKVRYDFGVCVACNSSMIEYFGIWRKLYPLHNADTPVAVIAFDDVSSEIEAECRDAGYIYLTEEPRRWRELGRRLYGDSIYGRKIRKAQYFSKLAAFDSPFEQFAYLDINSYMFFNARARFLKPEMEAVYFQYKSFRLRNYGSERAEALLREKIPNFETGFNACFFVSRNGYVTYEMAERSLANPEFADDQMGPAPEQSMFCWLAAVEGRKLALVRERWPEIRCAPPSDVYLDGKQAIRVETGHKIDYVKWSGANFREHYDNVRLVRQASEMEVPAALTV